MGEPRRCWLRWHNYSDSVTSALESLRYDEDFLDVTIACDGHSIRAHKLVLSACSAYFRKILKDHPCDHPIIILDGLGWQIVVSLLHFMYCGEVVVEEELLPNLLKAATNLDVTGLTHVTSAIISAQATKDEGNTERSDKDEESEGEQEEEYEDDEDEEEEEEEELDVEVEDEERPLQISEEVQKSTDDNGDESDVGGGGSSLSDGEVPPSKRPRRSSCDTPKAIVKLVVKTETQKQKDPDSTKTVSSTPKESGGVTQQKVTNGISPLTLPLHAATPLFNLPSSDKNSVKKEPPKSTTENDSEVAEKSKVKIVIMNGNSGIKDENFEVNDEEDFDDDCDSDPPENGDSEILKASLPLSFGKSGVILPEGLLETCGVPVGMTAAMGPVNYATLLATGNILPSTPTSKANSTVLIAPQGTNTNSLIEGKINLDKVVQQVLLPSIPVSGTVALTTVPSLTSRTTPATATSAPPTTTSSLSTSSPSQPYIHPPMVSLQEVQATLEQYQRKLAFHEPRPCPTCRRMYRDAATLRTHMAIMHSEGKEPFACTCGALFRTKYDMYQHKKNGHR